MRANVLILAALFGAAQQADARDGVLARCGASEGQGYYFQDDLWNPDGPEWTKDGMPDGQIVLVRLGDEWDIQFRDVVGASGYREDGAVVLTLGSTDSFLTVGAFRGTYVDTYTFNFAGAEVLWTSHKIGALSPMVAIYRAECTFTVSGPN